MQVFEKHITVTKNDLDELNHVNNVRYVQWVNDIAEAHWKLKASNEILNHYYWVMISHNITYKGQAVLNDVIYLKTYVTKSEGVTSTRMVEIFNKTTDKLITVSETNWCFMLRETHRITRIPKAINELFI